MTETYAEMGFLIDDHLKQSGRFHSQHEISFVAQDHEWTKAWGLGVEQVAVHRGAHVQTPDVGHRRKVFF